MLALLLACAQPAPPAPPLAPGPSQVEGPRPVLPLRLHLAAVTADVPRPVELAGLVTLLVEMGLTDLPDVLPQVGGTPLAPGLAAPLGPLGAAWEAWLEATGSADALTLTLTLCDPLRTCVEAAGQGEARDPTAAVAALLGAAADHLDRHPAPAVAADWAAPISADPYAVLLLGRSAATLYGQYPAADPADIGHSPRDPIARAAVVDPAMDEAWWVVGRQASGLGDLPRARTAAERGLAANPGRLALLADRAALLGALGQQTEADVAWGAALAVGPRDPRLLRPAAAARLGAGHPAAALALVELLSPTLAAQDPAVASLRVDIADATGEASDALLAAWAAVDPTNPAPVRRQIMARARAGAYADALPFTADLGQRGAAAEARAVEAGLSIATGDLRRAAAALEALGRPAVAARVRARELLPRSPAAAADLLAGAADPVAQIARAGALLQDGDPAEALTVITPVVGAQPNDPDALRVLAGALRALGRSEEATAAAARARWADPAGG